MTRPFLPGTVSIRSRLLLFLILSVLLTALAISLVTVFLGFRSARESVTGQLRSVTALKQQEIISWTSGLQLNLDIVLSGSSVQTDLRTLTRTLSDDPTRAAARERVQQQFLWAADRMGLFEEVFFMDKSGTVLLSTNAGHENQRLGLNDYFTNGLTGSFLEQPSYSLSLGKMTVVASTPVKDHDEVIGVLAGRAGLTGLNQIMIERPGLGDTDETYLVGSNHRLLTNLRQPGYSIPDTYIRTAGTDAAVDRQINGSASYRGYAGAKVIGVYTWIPELHVALLAEQEEAEALRPTQLMLLITGGVAVLAAALAIFAGIGLTKTIVSPLAELGTTAGRIAAGELELRARIVRGDEIGHLAHSFNRMTTQLGRLVHSLERRTDNLRAINQAGRQISSILALDELLPHVARSLLQTFAYQTVHILLLVDGTAADAATGATLLTYEEGEEAPSRMDFDEAAAERLPAVAVAAREGRPVLLDKAGEDTAMAPTAEAAAARAAALGALPGEETEQPGLVEIAVPIAVGEEALGVLAITAHGAETLDEQDLFAAQTLADQLAIAIQNARLYEHADELAASRERQRLARDLHDAVSQTLFSVSLIAEVLPRIYERNPEQGRQRLEELRQLTRGALAEMRTLLLELRPTALAQAKLPDLLKQLAEAVIGRSRIPVELETSPCPDLPVDVRTAFYRIAQEALNNIAKHSGAAHARVTLACGEKSDDGVHLTIEDDGAGFDPAAGGAGQLGLGIMRERAAGIGAHLRIESAPGTGTRVTVEWRPSAHPRPRV